MPEKSYLISELWFSRLQKLWQKSSATTFVGASVKNTDVSLVVTIPPPPTATASPERAWLKITSRTSVTTGIWDYTVDVYSNPWASTAIATGKTARNSREVGNTSGSQSGYAIVTTGAVCGDITGVDPIPTGSFHKILGSVLITGVTDERLIFSERNDPQIHS